VLRWSLAARPVGTAATAGP